MRIEEATTRELRRALRATIRAVGKDSESAQILQRELERRETVGKPTRPRPEPDRQEARP